MELAKPAAQREAEHRAFRPTSKMAFAAMRGLRLREKFGRGGTDVGVARAHQLIEQRELNADDLKSMHSFFAGHVIDKQTNTHAWGSDTDPSAGFIAWLLWGGDAGKAWADRNVRRLAK